MPEYVTEDGAQLTRDELEIIARAVETEDPDAVKQAKQIANAALAG
ncbi:hypothetical protein RYH80_18455 [Halobaculum sp. MBLA0147]